MLRSNVVKCRQTQLVRRNWLVELTRYTSAGCGTSAWVWSGMSCLWWWLLGQGCLTYVPGRLSLHVRLPTLLEPQGAVPPRYNPHWGARVITRCLRRHFWGECWWVPRHFWKYRACVDYGSAPEPTLKRVLCFTRPFGWARDKYRHSKTQRRDEIDLGRRVEIWHSEMLLDTGTIYQPLRSGRIWHKVNF